MLILLVACSPVVECDAAVSEANALAIDVSWPSTAVSRVRYTADGQTLETPSSSSGAFELLGIPADTLVSWVGLEDDVEVCAGETRTGTPPADLPVVNVTIDAAGQDEAGWVIGSFYKMNADDAWMAAYRRDGTLVWYLQGETHHNALDFAWSNGTFLHNEFHSDMVSDDSFVARTTLGGAPLETIPTPAGHHMFEEKADGTIAYQALDVREVDGEDWVGDAIVEIPPGGSPTPVFSAWDAIDPVWNTYMDGPDFYRGLDWTHGNALTWDGERYLVSFGHAGDLVVVEDGHATDVYGLDGLPVDPQFSYQHDAHWLPDGNILLFSTSDHSSAIEYSVSTDGLHEVWRHDLEGAALYLGQARRLPNGNTFVCGGQLGVMREVTPDGAVVWQMESTDYWGLAQWALVSDLYTGAE